MTPHWGKYFYLPFLPAISSSPSQTLEGRCVSPKSPQFASTLRPELQRIKDTVDCGSLGAEVQGHCQKQLTQTLIVCL